MIALVHIDQTWSYHFFEFNKPAISEVDFFTFMDDFYSSALLYVRTQINHQYGMTHSAYQKSIDIAFQICDKYPKLGSKIQQAFRDLHHTHRPAFGALQGPVVNDRSLCDDMGLLIGIVYEVEIRSVLEPILQS